jgi:hypothetical protein
MFGEMLRNEVATTKRIRIVNAKDPSRWSDRWLNYLICNDKEALKAWGPLSDHEVVQKSLAGYFVRTRGENGVSMCARGGHTLVYPTMVDEVVDVTGAGDAFTAGFAHSLVTEGWLHPEDQGKALTRGSQWAAHCCRQIGCGMPLNAASLDKEDTMGQTRGWVRVDKLAYNAQPLYRNSYSGELAYESLDAGRLVTLPESVEEVIRRQL